MGAPKGPRTKIGFEVKRVNDDKLVVEVVPMMSEQGGSVFYFRAFSLPYYREQFKSKDRWFGGSIEVHRSLTTSKELFRAAKILKLLEDETDLMEFNEKTLDAFRSVGKELIYDDRVGTFVEPEKIEDTGKEKYVAKEPKTGDVILTTLALNLEEAQRMLTKKAGELIGEGVSYEPEIVAWLGKKKVELDTNTVVPDVRSAEEKMRFVAEKGEYAKGENQEAEVVVEGAQA